MARGSRQRATPAAASAGYGRRVMVANRHRRLRVRPAEVERLVATLDAAAPALGIAPRRVPRGELSIVFLTDPALARLHGEFLDDPTVTDVITFEGDPVGMLPDAVASAGEICVSADAAVRYAREHATDFSTELSLYLVHGWLHLVGHDDLVPEKKRRMRRAEQRALAVLREADALPRFRLTGRAKRTRRSNA